MLGRSGGWVGTSLLKQYGHSYHTGFYMDKKKLKFLKYTLFTLFWGVYLCFYGHMKLENFSKNIWS